MMLYFAFNIGCSDDNSGLPTYSEYFLGAFKNRKISVINIVYDRDVEFGIEKRDWEGHTWYNCCLPLFLEKFYYELLDVIRTVIKEDGIKNIIVPDYLLQQYTEKIDLSGIKKTFFIHLLYRGMMDVFTKEPYFETHIQNGMAYLSTVAFREWREVKTADTIICNSKFTERQLKHFYYDCELEHKEIIVSPLGVDIKSIPYQPANDSTTWAYFGRFETQKGMVWLGKDFRQHTEEYRKNPLIVCGSGSMDTMLLKAHHFDGLVDYRGNLDKQKLWETLKDVKYCIFPSIYEPFGLALAEAMAMGKICVVSHKDSGMLEQMAHGHNAIVFNFQSNSIIEFIQRLNEEEDKEFFKQMSTNARADVKDIREHFRIISSIL